MSWPLQRYRYSPPSTDHHSRGAPLTLPSLIQPDGATVPCLTEVSSHQGKGGLRAHNASDLPTYTYDYLPLGFTPLSSPRVSEYGRRLLLLRQMDAHLVQHPLSLPLPPIPPTNFFAAPIRFSTTSAWVAAPPRACACLRAFIYTCALALALERPAVVAAFLYICALAWNGWQGAEQHRHRASER